MPGALPRRCRTAALSGLLLLAACGGSTPTTRQALATAQAQMQTSLPKSYVEDLVIESVAVEGEALVAVIRSPAGTAAKTRANPRFHELEQAERLDLFKWCNAPEIRPLLQTNAILKRRFVDRNGGVFFEVSMPARGCPPPNAAQEPEHAMRTTP